MKNRAFDYDTARFPRWIDPHDVTPYEGNAKAHTKAQVRNIARSIRRAGWQQDTVLTRDNVLVIGHGRRLAALEIGCMMPFHTVDKDADELTQEEIDILRDVDNLTSAQTGFDEKRLGVNFEKLNTLGFSFKLDNFKIDTSGFDDCADFEEYIKEQHEENKAKERFSDANILQLEKAQYVGVGEYDIPEILPEHIPEVRDWIGFNYVLTEKNPEGKGVHFFLNDYQFERIWNNPDRYIEKLSRFACVASPDFSPYSDMPFCLQLFNHYRKHWVGRYLQENGVHVIPTIRTNTNERSRLFYLDGEPVGGSVIISSMYTTGADVQAIYREEYERMLKTLKPERIYIYGRLYGWEHGNVTQIETFTERRFGSGQ